MRLIDADALKKAIDLPFLDEIKLGSIINNAPTIDAEPVVRCKDCKYRWLIDFPVCCESTDERFCADGERKGGDTK